MFFSQLSTLEARFSHSVLDAFDKYLSSLTPTAATLITANKLSLATGESFSLCLEFLKACLDIGFMYKRYALLCPECKTPIRMIDTLDDLVDLEEEYCHRCDEVIQYEDTNLADNVILVFSMRDTSLPFVNRQQPIDLSEDIELRAVPPYGNLSEAVQYRIVGYDELFSYNDSTQQMLLLQIAEIKKPNKTTTETGAALEVFCKNLFRLCSVFKATNDLRTETNQIDAFIRITSVIPNGLFGVQSNYYVIECKNESSTPKGEYINKLHSIMHSMDAKLGIIISRIAPPRTYPKLARDVFLRDNICIIWFYLSELEDMVRSQKNLLDLIDQKVLELKTNATRPLSEIGLY